MRSKVSFIIVAVAVAVPALLAGCSSDEAGASGENTNVCNNFAADHNDFVRLMTAGPGSAENIETWTADRAAAVDKIAALPGTATGDVASSMTTFVEAIPADTLELSAADSASGTAFVDNGKAVASACEADGTSISLDQLTVVTFEN